MSGKQVPLTRTLEWIAATICVSVATVFAVMRFAYSDFETQRSTDIYRAQMDKRLEMISSSLDHLNDKVDRLLPSKSK